MFLNVYAVYLPLLTSSTVTADNVGTRVVIPEKVIISKKKRSSPFFLSLVMPMDKFKINVYHCKDSSAAPIKSFSEPNPARGLYFGDPCWMHGHVRLWFIAISLTTLQCDLTNKPTRWSLKAGAKMKKSIFYIN